MAEKKKTAKRRKPSTRQKALAEKAAFKAAQEARYTDYVVNSNVLGDLHRVLQDRLDCQYSMPVAGFDFFTRAEISRRATFLLLDDAATSVAVRWRDFEPEPVDWAASEPLEARQQVIASLRNSLEEEAPSIESGVRTDMLDWYEEERKPGCKLSPEEIADSIEQGITHGRAVLDGLLTELEQDEPRRDYPGAADHRVTALNVCWDIVAKHMKDHVPEELDELPKNPAALYRIALFDVGQTALHQAFNLAAFGVVDAESGDRAAPRMFAGSILTELNIPQLYDDPDDEDPVARAKAEKAGEPLVPCPCNGEPAETPQAVQVREMFMTCSIIGNDLAGGELKEEVRDRFRMLAGLAFGAQPVPKGFTATTAMKKKAYDAFWDVLDEIRGDMNVEIKAGDGFVIDRRKLKTVDDKMAVSDVPFVTCERAGTATLQ